MTVLVFSCICGILAHTLPLSPFMLGIVPMGGRSTAIKVETGGVWILASTALNNETKQKLDELGEVK